MTNVIFAMKVKYRVTTPGIMPKLMDMLSNSQQMWERRLKQYKDAKNWNELRSVWHAPNSLRPTQASRHANWKTTNWYYAGYGRNLTSTNRNVVANHLFAEKGWNTMPMCRLWKVKWFKYLGLLRNSARRWLHWLPWWRHKITSIGR